MINKKKRCFNLNLFFVKILKKHLLTNVLCFNRLVKKQQNVVKYQTEC